jgi:hypothetical protein
MVTTQRHPPYSLDLAAADFYLSLDWNHDWRDRAFVVLLTLRMQRKSWKGFYKMAFTIAYNTFTVAAICVWLHKGTILKEM